MIFLLAGVNLLSAGFFYEVTGGMVRLPAGVNFPNQISCPWYTKSLCRRT